MGAADSAFGQGLAAVALHTASLLAVAAAIAFLVYDRLGLRLLKKAWINLDALWAVALIAAGFLVLFTWSAAACSPWPSGDNRSRF